MTTHPQLNPKRARARTIDDKTEYDQATGCTTFLRLVADRRDEVATRNESGVKMKKIRLARRRNAKPM